MISLKVISLIKQARPGRRVEIVCVSRIDHIQAERLIRCLFVCVIICEYASVQGSSLF